MSSVQEQYECKPLTSNSTYNLTPTPGNSTKVGGFLCTTAGNLKIGSQADGSGAVLIATFPVVVGVFYPLPFTFAVDAAVVLSGGAAGTLGVSV